LTVALGEALGLADADPLAVLVGLLLELGLPDWVSLLQAPNRARPAVRPATIIMRMIGLRRRVDDWRIGVGVTRYGLGFQVGSARSACRPYPATL
jgi:hypothetical protein